jgi:hypothetical protein
MTHYKKHWLLLLAKRLSESNRVIIKKELLATFLCYAMKCDFLGSEYNIKCIETRYHIIICCL